VKKKILIGIEGLYTVEFIILILK